MKPCLVAVTLALIALGGKGQAHEFWIDPLAYEIEAGATLEAQLLTGEEFSGSPSAYLPRNFATFDVLTAGTVREVEGRLGDIPALAMEDMADGLAVVVHQTTERLLTWSTWERFLNFANHKDLGDVAAFQSERGLDQEDVRESYTRYAKSLVAVGDGAGADQRVGLYTELVALANPYTDALDGVMPVELWYDGARQPDTQIELFELAPDGSVTITLHRTDDDGVAYLPVQSGHVYMADAVALEPIEPVEARDPEWLTHWANLTFAVR